MPQPRSKTIQFDEVFLIIALFSGWFVFASIQAMLSGFPTPRLSDNEALGLILFELLMFCAAAAVLMSRGWQKDEFKCRVTWLLSFTAVLLFGATYLLHWGIWELFGGYLGGRDVLVAFAQNITLTFPVALALSVVNGAFEEFFLTRYLIDTFAPHGASVALGLSTLIRVLCHIYQGPTGAVSIFAFGLVLTLFYWRFGELWPVVLAHMLADFVAFI
jgi:uncharacterized protein